MPNNTDDPGKIHIQQLDAQGRVYREFFRHPRTLAEQEEVLTRHIPLAYNMESTRVTTHPRGANVATSVDPAAEREWRKQMGA